MPLIDQEKLLGFYTQLKFSTEIRVNLISIFSLLKKHFEPVGGSLFYCDPCGKMEILDIFGDCEDLYREPGDQPGIWIRDNVIEIDFPGTGSITFLFQTRFDNNDITNLMPLINQIHGWNCHLRTHQNLKEREVKLKRNERRYRILVEHAENGILITQDQKVKFANRRACSILKAPITALVDQDFTPMIHPEDLNMILDRHRRRMLGENLPDIYDFRVITTDQEVRWVELHVTLVEWEGRPATLNFLRDITVEKRLKYELQQKQKSEAIGMLAGGIAHDFGNLLMPIIGYAEMILEEVKPGDEVGDSASIILDSALRAHDLVKQILTFSRQEEPVFTTINLCELVQEVLHLITSSLEKGIKVIRKIDCENCIIYGNEIQIHQVLMNLVTNSIQAMGGRGTLTINLEEISGESSHICTICNDQLDADQRYLKLTISDTGSGIAPDILDRIFDPYFTTKKPGKGTGLGLAVVQGIVEHHRGILDVDSVAGEGTSFHIYFPGNQQKKKGFTTGEDGVISTEEGMAFTPQKKITNEQ